MNQFTKLQLKTLRRFGFISLIAKTVPSKRSKTGHLSRVHVRKILTGEYAPETDVTYKVINLANEYLDSIKKLSL